MTSRTLFLNSEYFKTTLTVRSMYFKPENFVIIFHLCIYVIIQNKQC